MCAHHLRVLEIDEDDESLALAGHSDAFASACSDHLVRCAFLEACYA